MTNVVLSSAQRVTGRVEVPGSKSSSHRAVLLSALASGESSISHISRGEDVLGTINLVSSLGAHSEWRGDTLFIAGPNDGLRATTRPLDCGNSGTTIRLVAGMLAGVEGEHTLEGDASLSRRPMNRVAVPLRLMGVRIEGHGDTETAPLRIHGARVLRAINYTLPVSSAQVKSAIMFAALFGDGASTVVEENRTRPDTEVMMSLAGIRVESTSLGAGRSVTVYPGRPSARSWRIPGDPSQAAFFIVLALLVEGGQVTISDLDSAPERNGFIDVLMRMGARIERAESDGLLSVSASSSQLSSTVIDASEIPSVDEVPILVVAAAAASGATRFTDMSELRIKESDRFATSVALARALGCQVDVDNDDFVVHGLGSAKNFDAIDIDGGLDHRVVMSASIAATAGNGGTIRNIETVASSYPNFFDHLDSLQS
jgi:3-phosphoshikimate 1-carboxyvinyltransferase